MPKKNLDQIIENLQPDAAGQENEFYGYAGIDLNEQLIVISSLLIFFV